jgi:hypothetical protein
MPLPYPTPMPAPGWPDRTGPSSGAPVALPVPTFTPYPMTAPGFGSAPTITIPLDGGASIVIALPEDGAISLSSADLRALRAVAAPLVAELAKRGLLAPAKDTLEEP